jgi:hypothetical protein
MVLLKVASGSAHLESIVEPIIVRGEAVGDKDSAIAELKFHINLIRHPFNTGRFSCSEQPRRG